VPELVRFALLLCSARKTANRLIFSILVQTTWRNWYAPRFENVSGSFRGGRSLPGAAKSGPAAPTRSGHDPCVEGGEV
jgi:hypothetical protein